MSITSSNGYIVVEFEARGLSARPAIDGCLLKFMVQYSIPELREVGISFRETSVKVYVDEIFLGTAHPESPIVYSQNQHSQNSGILYELQVSQHAVEKIERLRGGGDIEFSLEIKGKCISDSYVMYPSDSIKYRTNQKEWIDLLRTINHKDGVLLELPFDIDSSDELKAAYQSIDIAKNHLYYGNYDDVVAKCRVALESITTHSGKIREIRKIFKEKKKSMSKDERFLNAIDNLANYTHLSHHPSEAGEYISFSRSEAIFVLGSTVSALASYVEHKI